MEMTYKGYLLFNLENDQAICQSIIWNCASQQQVERIALNTIHLRTLRAVLCPARRICNLLCYKMLCTTFSVDSGDSKTPKAFDWLSGFYYL